MRPETLLTAREATALLGVKAATLYAYVSRGLLRTAPGPDARSRLYLREDVEKLRLRGQAGRGAGAAAAGALRWGEPVLESAITEIADGQLYYRGLPAVDLAQRSLPFENVAEFLWTGVLSTAPISWEAPAAADADRLQWLAAMRDAALQKGAGPEAPPPITAALLAHAVVTFGLSHPEAPEAQLDVTLRKARRLIGMLAGTPERKRGEPPVPLAAALWRSLASRQTMSAVPEARAIRAIDCALTLCADHELNASTFAARVAASTDADLYACFLSALGAMSGPRHGGAVNEVERFLGTLPARRLGEHVIERLRAGGDVPGFGHQLYPEGDPRALPLLEHAAALAPHQPQQKRIWDLISAVADAAASPAAAFASTVGAPNLDLGLAALASALGLGPGGAMALFALGRTAGWTAHVVEQRQQGFLLRPRAKYVGRPPARLSQPLTQSISR